MSSLAAHEAPPLALVTGGTRGIGAAVSRRLLADGYAVLACYMRNRRAAEAFAASLPADQAPRWRAVKANVAEEDELVALAAAVAEQGGGRLRALVLNAASGVLKPLGEQTRRHWDWTVGINAWSALRLAQLCRPLMGPASAVVALSSPGAVRAIADYGAVGVSKAALEAIVRQLAAEWGPAGIRVNVVRAGLVPTEALDHFPDREALTRATLARTPLGRLVTPEDVAHAVAFLLSPAAGAIHGATLVVDGGEGSGDR